MWRRSSLTRDRRVGRGVHAARDPRVDLPQRDLVGDRDHGLQPGPARLLDVVGRRLGREPGAEHGLAREIAVARVLQHRAGDDLAQPLALEREALDEPVERRGQHVLVGRVRVGPVRARERDPVAADDGDASWSSSRPQSGFDGADQELGGALGGQLAGAQPPAAQRLGGAEDGHRQRLDGAALGGSAATRSRAPPSARGTRRRARRSRRRRAASRRAARRHASPSESRNAKNAWMPARSAAGASARPARRRRRRPPARRRPASCTPGTAAPCCRSSCRAAVS